MLVDVDDYVDLNVDGLAQAKYNVHLHRDETDHVNPPRHICQRQAGRLIALALTFLCCHLAACSRGCDRKTKSLRRLKHLCFTAFSLTFNRKYLHT